MQDIEFIHVLNHFKGRSFSTFEFANEFKNSFPKEWNLIVEEYGEGGKGAGKHYTAFSRISQYLNQRSHKGDLNKLDYRPAPPEWGNSIIRYWSENKSHIGAQDFPEEIVSSEKIIEGAKKSIVVNSYERSSKSKAECIEHWGIKYFVCGFDFEDTYGAIGAGFIHIHHLKPISEIGKEYELNPKDDLRPLCPNCHAMAHREDPVLSIKKLKTLLNKI